MRAQNEMLLSPRRFHPFSLSLSPSSILSPSLGSDFSGPEVAFSPGKDDLGVSGVPPSERRNANADDGNGVSKGNLLAHAEAHRDGLRGGRGRGRRSGRARRRRYSLEGRDAESSTRGERIGCGESASRGP